MRRGPPRRLSHPDYDAGREEFARAQECVGIDLVGHECSGVMEASHERNPEGQLPTGTGRKEPSRLTVGKCSGLHREWTDATGPFDGWPNVIRHSWMAVEILALNDKWDRLTDDARATWQLVAIARRAERAAALRGQP
jgi:hypothetical protein